MMEKIQVYDINPKTRTIDILEMERSVEAMHKAFPYGNGNCVPFHNGDTTTMLLFNPYGHKEGTAIKDGVFYINDPDVGWVKLAGHVFVFGGIDDAKDDDEIYTAKLSAEEVSKYISWKKPEDCPSERDWLATDRDIH